MEEIFEDFKEIFTQQEEHLIEACILDLEKDLEIAVYEENYEKAQNIKNKLNELREK